jgi:hypothetical protein
MALDTGSAKLHLALKNLRLHWDETKSRWNDPVSQVFEDDHLTPLENQVLSTLKAIDRLAQEVAKARQECG